MDGYALRRKFRMLPSHEGDRTPAVALTANVREDDAHRAFAWVPAPLAPSLVFALRLHELCMSFAWVAG